MANNVVRSEDDVVEVEELLGYAGVHFAGQFGDSVGVCRCREGFLVKGRRLVAHDGDGTQADHAFGAVLDGGVADDGFPAQVVLVGVDAGVVAEVLGRHGCAVDHVGRAICLEYLVDAHLVQAGDFDEAAEGGDVFEFAAR